jgi:hypothetical protein
VKKRLGFDQFEKRMITKLFDVCGNAVKGGGERRKKK